jgi:mitochondrial-processing peptidase subunit alpha
LYTEVLNTYHWSESVEAFLSVNEESGMLGIDGACPPDAIRSMIRVIIDQFITLSEKPVTHEELSRAKNMLKSTMMMNLESRLLLCEDIVRQYITYNQRESPASLCEKIDQVTKEDLIKVATIMLSKPPAVACVGHDLSDAPSHASITHFIDQYKNRPW